MGVPADRRPALGLTSHAGYGTFPLNGDEAPIIAQLIGADRPVNPLLQLFRREPSGFMLRSVRNQ